MPDDPRPKFRRRSEARPDEILDAALALFDRKGFAQTRVEDIAEAAGLSKGAVYLYFDSKEALLEGLVRRAVAPVAERAAGALAAATGDLRDTLAAVLKGVATALGDPRTAAVPILVMREAPNVPRIAEIYRDEVLARVFPAFAGLISAAIRGGRIRPVDPVLTVRTMIGAMIAQLLLSNVFGVRLPEGVTVDAMIDHHLDVVFRGLDPRMEETQ